VPWCRSRPEAAQPPPGKGTHGAPRPGRDPLPGPVGPPGMTRLDHERSNLKRSWSRRIVRNVHDAGRVQIDDNVGASTHRPSPQRKHHDGVAALGCRSITAGSTPPSRRA
jgi:hypothetical protein